jgi:hypothetical protein
MTSRYFHQNRVWPVGVLRYLPERHLTRRHFIRANVLRGSKIFARKTFDLKTFAQRYFCSQDIFPEDISFGLMSSGHMSSEQLFLRANVSSGKCPPENHPPEKKSFWQMSSRQKTSGKCLLSNLRAIVCRANVNRAYILGTNLSPDKCIYRQKSSG